MLRELMKKVKKKKKTEKKQEPILHQYTALDSLFKTEEQKPNVTMYEVNCSCMNCGNKQIVKIPKFFEIRTLYQDDIESLCCAERCVIVSNKAEFYFLPRCNYCGCLTLDKDVN